jgi:DNA-binding transcriptional LysR family regulator
LNIVLNTADGPVRLEHGEHDVAVYPRHLIQDGGAICRPLLRSQFVLAASKAYLDRVGRAPSAHDLSGHVLVSSVVDGHAQPDLRLDLDGTVITPVAPAVTMIVSEPVAVQLALSGFGMALVPRATVECHIADARLQFILPNCRVTYAPADLDVAFVRRQSLPRRTREFVDTCVQFFKPVVRPTVAHGLAVAA